MGCSKSVKESVTIFFFKVRLTATGEMDHYRNSGKIDPDYESYNSALELNEEEDKKENLIKIRKIIDDEYTKEINQRQAQIEQIELQICKVRKLLHLLRYALVMSYYKKKELEYSGPDDEPSTSDTIIPDKQTQIHPAVKKLLGKNVHNLDHLNIRDKRKSNQRYNLSPRVKSPEIIPESKKIKLDLDVSEKVSQVSHKNSLEFIRSRKKVKYRIIVGNISKWMPLSEDDILTHKWMVYVRGPKEKPDVSHFINKVVFFLHPSYKPHDVVEICESPFHLSRRGWGEFPVRVQIFFQVTLNKPIDVVHNIKLDKTYSGRQTLGNETIIDVFLYDFCETAPEMNPPILEDLIDEQDIKIEDEAMTSIEHDYCSGLTKGTNDHLYCLPEGVPKPKKDKVVQDESNELMYGLDTYYRDPNDVKVVNTFKQLIQLNRKDIKFSNTNIIVFGKKIGGTFLNNFNELIAPRHGNSPSKNDGNSIKVTLPQNRFKNIGEALPYLFKRLPLCSDLANNLIYKRLYPFTASSLKEFVSWNVGKRRSSEWSRARTIKKILMTGKIQGVENWSTKAILMYGRSHDYTPFESYGLFNRDSNEKKLLLSCYANSVENTVKSIYKDEPEVTVNVDDTEMTPPKKNNVIDISDPHLKLECSYIRQTSLDCGIILKPEEIVEGVKVNGAEMMLLEAAKCLAENLIRRAKNHRVCTRILSPSTSAINREDVEYAINERPEMLCLRQFKNQRRNFEYFS